HPKLVDKLVFGGLGIGMVEGVGDWDPIADALLAPSLDDVTHARGRMFRAFADQTGSDRIALAACISASRTLLTPDQMSEITAKTLIAVGTKDDIAGAPGPLAHMMPNAKAIDIEGRDHMLAVGDKQFKAAVLALFSENP
ncbi:MAG: alpha/beta hydrolase, partial [Pseudomonadota bacterium]